MLSLKEKQPNTVGEVRQILGFLSYYRSYIQDFSRIAKPLYELLATPPAQNQQDTMTQKNTKKVKTNRLKDSCPLLPLSNGLTLIIRFCVIWLIDCLILLS